MYQTSESQRVFETLRRFLAHYCWAHQDDVPDAPSADFIDWSGIYIYDELPFDEFTKTLARIFGCPPDETLSFLMDTSEERMSRNEPFAFGEIVDWLAEHGRLPNFDPVNVAGKMCGPAGAFWGV